MKANLVLSMTTTGDKNESENGISLEKIESGNVLTENNKGSIGITSKCSIRF